MNPSIVSIPRSTLLQVHSIDPHNKACQARRELSILVAEQHNTWGSAEPGSLAEKLCRYGMSVESLNKTCDQKTVSWTVHYYEGLTCELLPFQYANTVKIIEFALVFIIGCMAGAKYQV